VNIDPADIGERLVGRPDLADWMHELASSLAGLVSQELAGSAAAKAASRPTAGPAPSARPRRRGAPRCLTVGELVDDCEAEALGVARTLDGFSFLRSEGIARLGAVLGELRAKLGGDGKAAYAYTLARGEGSGGGDEPDDDADDDEADEAPDEAPTE
jgi:hypothetical protein